MSDLDKRLTEALKAVRNSYAEERHDERFEARARFIERHRRRRRMFAVGSVALAGVGLAAGLLFTGGRLDIFADRKPPSDLAGDLPPGVVSATATGSDPVDSAIRLGEVWVANSGDSNVVHLDPSTDRIVAEIPLDGPPQEVDAGQTNVWVAGFGRVTAIDPATDEVIGSAAVGDEDAALSISVGERYIWTVIDESRLVRVDPETYEVELVETTSAPVDVAARDGSVWVLDSRAGLMRLDPVSTEVLDSPAETFRVSADVSAGRGVVWVASDQDDTVIRFAADGSAPPGVFRVEGTYLDMAVNQSIVWVLSKSNGHAFLTALNSTTARSLGEPIRLEGDPVEVSSGDGYVWVVARGLGAILRIDPAAVAR